jgi:hypothetical protein
MRGYSKRARGALAFSAAATIVFATIGCGDDSGMAKRYKVYGTVTYNGKPVEKGQIAFVPEKGDAQGAQGQIDNGSYSLTTLSPGDGALPGSYKVTIDTRQIDDAALKAATKKFAEQNKIEGLAMPPQDVQARMYQKARSATPAKYMTPDATDLKAEVKEQSNKIDFELKD